MDGKFIDICGVPTKICTLGKKLEENFDRKEIVLIITGNPGLSGFYLTFITTLFKFLHGNIPVWLIGKTCIFFFSINAFFHVIFDFNFIPKVTVVMKSLNMNQ